LRLAVVSPFLDRQHGTELCVIEQIERLACQHHWEIHVYSQRVRDVRGLQLAGDSVLDSPGGIFWHKVSALPGPHLLNYLWWFVVNHWQRSRDLRSRKVQPDLVYAPGINCLDADVAVVHIVFHAFYERVRRELALHRNPVRTWPRLLHRKLYYRLIMLLEQKIYRNPRTHLIAVSGLVAKQLKTYFQRDDAAVISNAIDTVRFTPQARAAKRSSSRHLFGYIDSDFVVLLIGNDWKKKGLVTLLNALASLKALPVRALVVGHDDPKIYHGLLNQLGLKDRVKFEQPTDDVLSFYAAADLYVGPSLEDAFNLPIVEAMACGIPVIASAQTGASELIQDGQTGFILNDPLGHVRLAELTARIYRDETLRTTVGAAARHTAERCSWDENVQRTRKFVEGVFKAPEI
jgi:glycosyltransferase involved in cell wall biosynthesis